MVFRYQDVLANGTRYRFRCEPVDPSDAFRGKYVQLRFSQQEVEHSDTNSDFKTGQSVYAYLRVDSAGYAHVSKISVLGNSQNDNFSTKIEYVSTYSGTRIYFPFERYYMNEKTAPMAEKAYRHEARIDSVYLDVRVYHGKAVTEELYMNGMPVREYLEKLPVSDN